MKITIVSHFRNAQNYIERYFEQIDKLDAVLHKQGFNLSLVLGYGDSTDHTHALLHENSMCRNYGSLLVDVSHGGHHYGSIVHKERFKQLAHVGNTLWKHIPEDAKIVGLVESDLLWDEYNLYNLIHLLEQQDKFILAPMVMHLDGRFYDTWAFRMNGRNFRNEKPFHTELSQDRRFYKMESIGSCAFMQSGLARKLHWPEEDVFVGFCRLARESGATILLDSFSEVYHV